MTTSGKSAAETQDTSTLAVVSQHPGTNTATTMHDRVAIDHTRRDIEAR